MIRLLGFLSGLLLVIALAFVVLRYPPAGLPGDRLSVRTDSGDSAVAAAAQEEPAQDSTSAPARNPAEQPGRERTQEPTRGSFPETEQEPLKSAVPAETLPRVDDPPPIPVAEASTDGGGAAGDATAADEADESGRQWHAFWQPFHSEISAEGFRRRLEGVTGLDYRVVSPRPGEYQVAFAYRNEAERQENLAAIEAATGLVLRSQML